MADEDPGQVQVRTIDTSEAADWLQAKDLGFLATRNASYDELAPHALVGMDLDRTWGAIDDGKVVGTLRSFPTRMTVPGGPDPDDSAGHPALTVESAALTNVTVSPTHRRRGLLTQMLAGDLTASVEREEAVGILIASEFPIYGRFGYGAAVESATYTVDTRSARFERGTTGRVELVDFATLRLEAPRVYDLFRRGTPGALVRDEHRWDRDMHKVVWPGDSPAKGYCALYRSDGGRIEGYLKYHAEPKWDDMRHQGQVTVDEMVSVTPEAYASLWRYCCEIDLVTTVRASERCVEEPLVWLLADGRAMRQSARFDFLWVRVLDVSAALGARRYMTEGRVVLEVVDELGFASGRFALDGGPDGATCGRSSESPHLSMHVGTLGSVYLGGFSVRALAQAGRISEHLPGAVSRADSMFRSGVTPWCTTWF